MLNNAMIMGRLTRDPELRKTNNGLPVVSFTLAVERDVAENGNRGVDFVECVAWRNTAEFVQRYFVKGQMAIVAGRLQVREWTDKNGMKRKTTEVVAYNVYFGEPKRTQTDPAEELSEIVDEDEDMPF